MPNPIQSTLNSSSYLPLEGASAEENDGQVCLSPVLPNASVSDATAGAGTTQPTTSPAVGSLVARFTTPIGSHPPVEASLGEALGACAWEIAGAANAVASTLVTPVGLATTLVTGMRSLISVGTAERCIERDEARQIAEATRRDQSADCERDGAIPLVKADNSVICAVP
ncbi:MAG: hypothetical protein ABIQ16_02440 [Polyangiaceae bacterium]